MGDPCTGVHDAISPRALRLRSQAEAHVLPRSSKTQGERGLLSAGALTGPRYAVVTGFPNGTGRAVFRRACDEGAVCFSYVQQDRKLEGLPGLRVHDKAPSEG